MTHSNVAAVIVTYNSERYIEACVDAAKLAVSEVVVIDNASCDDTTRRSVARGARVIVNHSNRGFAGAVNQGVNATKSPFILLLNPDAVLISDIHPLASECENGHTAAAAGQLCDAAGVPQRGFTLRRFPTPMSLALESLAINRIWPHNSVNWHYRCFDCDLTQPGYVEQPAGAFLLFRRDAWERIGGFDEGFFPIWFEDADFCKRLRDAGYRIAYRPECVAKHTGAHSLTTLSLGQKTDYWYRSLLRYSNKHFGLWGRIFTGFSVIAGQIPRIIAGGGQYRSRQMAAIYGRIGRLAFRSMRAGRVRLHEVLN